LRAAKAKNQPTTQIATPHPSPLPRERGWSVPVPSPVARPYQRRIFAPFSPCGRRVGDEGEVNGNTKSSTPEIIY